MKKEPNAAVTFGVLSLFMMITATSLATASLAFIGQAFPDVPSSSITYCTTLAALLMMPASIVSGMIAGTKVKAKTVAAVGIIICVLSGILPAFTGSNFTIVLASRAIFGFGNGLCTPLGASFIAKLFDPSQHAKLNGWGLAVQQAISLVYNYMGSLLAERSLSYMWMSHIIFVIPLLLIMFLIPEEAPVAAANTKDGADTPKVTLPFSTYVNIIWHCLLALFPVPLALNVTFMVINNGGTAVAAATAYSLYTAGGIVGGLFFGSIFKMFGKFTIPFVLVVGAVGAFLSSLIPSVTVLMIGSFITGFAFSTLVPANVTDLSAGAAPELAPKIIGLFYALNSFVFFLATPFMQIIASVSGNSSESLPVLVGGVCMAVLAVVWAILKAGQKS